LLLRLTPEFAKGNFVKTFGIKNESEKRLKPARTWGALLILASLIASTCMIEVQGLTKLYGDFVAVNELSFNVRPGEVMGLVGPNGAGKTTTLRCLAGIIPPTRGVIRICGGDLAQDPISAKKQLAFLTDEPRLFDYLTVWQHLNFIARIYQVVNYEPIALALLSELELTDKRDKLPGELSRGMKQKLAIACGLLHSPKVIYFDEPLTGLDPLGIRRMKDSILKRARGGAAIIISSHLLHLVEEICSHILILKSGRKVIDGTLAEITQKFWQEPGDANLEEVFFRATSEPPASPPIVSDATKS
jgi:ABC-2 type transport system ATP-binding protein